MMLNDRDRSRAIHKLLSERDLWFLWKSSDFATDVGPTDRGMHELDLVKEGTSSLSYGEKIILRVAFDLWNGAGQASIWEIMSHLEPSMVHRIGDLIKVCLPIPR